MLTDALAIHQSTLEAVAGESVTYSRGAQTFTTVAVIARRKPDSEERRRSTAITARIVDWLISPSNFELEEPMIADRITSADGRVFEVRSQNNLPHWEWSDPRQTFMRIHTIEQKRVEP